MILRSQVQKPEPTAAVEIETCWRLHTNHHIGFLASSLLAMISWKRGYARSLVRKGACFGNSIKQPGSRISRASRDGE